MRTFWCWAATVAFLLSATLTEQAAFPSKYPRAKAKEMKCGEKTSQIPKEISMKLDDKKKRCSFKFNLNTTAELNCENFNLSGNSRKGAKNCMIIKSKGTKGKNKPQRFCEPNNPVNVPLAGKVTITVKMSGNKKSRTQRRRKPRKNLPPGRGRGKRFAGQTLEDGMDNPDHVGVLSRRKRQEEDDDNDSDEDENDESDSEEDESNENDNEEDESDENDSEEDDNDESDSDEDDNDEDDSDEDDSDEDDNDEDDSDEDDSDEDDSDEDDNDTDTDGDTNNDDSVVGYRFQCSVT